MNMHRDVVSRLLVLTFALRASLAALAAAAQIPTGDVAFAQPSPAPPIAEDQRLLPYVKPGQLVDIGGRKINLHCTVPVALRSF